MKEEEALLSALKDPEQRERAFRELMSTYKERLYWHIRKIVLSHDDSDDILQNTFVKVFRSIDKFKGDSKLFSWMYRIATNEAITFLNKKAKMQQVDIADLQYKMAENLEADEYFDGDEAQLTLQKAVATLPQKQQLVFNMKYFDEMKYNDIAEVLDTTVGALKSSYHHAVKKIENYLKKMD
ncbi:RNA polymerase sigma factor [Flavobacteriaceae bacterium F08102]|nr:RNA polymerase sigma factor [Flavobacteriaceae bacterium F08102]